MASGGPGVESGTAARESQPDEGPVGVGVPSTTSCLAGQAVLILSIITAMDANPSPVDAALGRAGYRATAARRAVIDLIAGREGHFTAADLVDDAKSQGRRIGRATIFRTLDVLAGLRAVERIDLPSGDHAYVACDPVHHHHVVCSVCGRSRDIDDAGLRSVVREVARRTGYRVDEHRLELFGQCPDCLTRGSS